MPTPFDPQKHHRRSIRLKGWDYASGGVYFVTICTHERQNLFTDPRLQEIVATTWTNIPQQAHAQHVALDEWVVMPNHVHGLLILQPESSPEQAQVGQRLIPGSLGAIVGNFKMLVTKRVKAFLQAGGMDMRVWHRGYYERIVRNERELNAIRKYIIENPLRWAEDRENFDELLPKMRYVRGG